MNLFKIPTYQLYLLQLENYELRRYWNLIRQKGLLPPETGLRKKLIWTKKAILIFVVSAFLIFAAALNLAIFLHSHALENPVAALVALIGAIVVLTMLAFIFFSLATLLIFPLDYSFKFYLISRAKMKILELSNLRIIGIAGSYGKTTVKEVLKQVLGSRFQVLATPESVNTPVGVARWVLKSVDETTQVIIVEMGEHYRGDILELCKLAPPDMAVITGINEAHLERMRTPENVVATIFELAQGTKDKGMLVLNADDKQVMENYSEYTLPGQMVEKYSSRGARLSDGREDASGWQLQKFNQDDLYWECAHKDLGNINIRLLGGYALGMVDCSIKIAKFLGLASQEIRAGIEKIRPISHRLEPSFSPGGILVIDDAYNGNSDGAREAIQVLARFKDRRKIYITPGLVETGSASKLVHMEIGRQLAQVADVVILIRNSVASWIEEGILAESRQTGKPANQIIWFDSAPEAHSALSNILKPNDVILFQNDWGDQYL